MEFILKILIGIVALEHIYILWIEMFAWTTKGVSTFKSLPKELFPKTKALAANQGLYNGFLSAGLIWSLLISDPIWFKNIAIFFLFVNNCSSLWSNNTSKSIFIKQGIPALITMLILIFL